MSTADVMPIYFAILLSSTFVVLQGGSARQYLRKDLPPRSRRTPGHATQAGLPACVLTDEHRILRTGQGGLLALLAALWLALQLRSSGTLAPADLLSLRVCLAGSTLLIGQMALQLVRRPTLARVRSAVR